MLTLQPITGQDRETLNGSSFASMADEEWERLIAESSSHLHNGRYFSFLKVTEENTVIGFMALYAHSPHIISCGPEIKPPYRNRGCAYQAEQLALEAAKAWGYTIAVAYVRESNTASIRLHEKLGFEQDTAFINAHEKKMRLYIKAL